MTTPAQSFPDWYATAPGDDLEQGDILRSFPLIVVDDVTEEVGVTARTRACDVVVMTQTCDIPKQAQTTILLAELHDYDFLCDAAGYQHLRGKQVRTALRDGTAVGLFLLPPDAATGMTWSLVIFRQLHIVSKGLVARRAASHSHIRLLSPYKEHLSQGFARFMMRVGLPTTLDSFDQYKPRAMSPGAT